MKVKVVGLSMSLGEHGRQLCNKAFDLAAQKGFKSLTLWVLTENSRGRAFYEAMGMHADGAVKREERPDCVLDEVRYRTGLGHAGE